MSPVSLKHGSGPIILAQPHSGTFVPDDIRANLNDLGRQLIDTDWHVPKLYDGLVENVTTVQANFSRYVIDPNRNPQGISLYPGQNTTDLVPLSTFDGEAIWRHEPSQDAIAERLELFHKPYHQALADEIDRVKAKHGFVVLYDCHSIRSKIPYLFDDQLPDLNIGTNSGASCSTEISSAAQEVCEQHAQYSHVVNGRFKGGWTTRHYGQPKNNVHCVQMELAQRAYLKNEIPPFEYDPAKAAELRSVLSSILQKIQSTAKANLLSVNEYE